MRLQRLVVVLALLSISLGVGSPSAQASTAGYQYSACSNGGRSFSARLYWNDAGFLYKLEFKTPDARVRDVFLRGITSLDPAWASNEQWSSFPQGSSYQTRTVRSGEAWGWHWHWSGQWVLYQSALTLYLDDGNWDPDCTIHFDEETYRFS